MRRFIASRLLAAIALLALPVVLAGVAIAAPAAQEGTVVEMQDDFFVPEMLTVSVGTTVTWQNTGQRPHTATADDETFDTGILNSGQQGSFTFNTPGTYPYYCQLHGSPGGVGMAGTIVVEAAQPTPEPTPMPEPTPEPAPVTMPDTGVSGTSAITLGLIAACMLLIGIGVRRSMQRRAGVR